MYSSTTAVVLQQHVQHPTHRPNQSRTGAQQHVQQQCVSTFMQRLLLHGYGISLFFRSPAISGTCAVFFNAPRVSSLALGPVFSPIRPCAAMWGGRGAVARPRGGGGARESRSKTGRTEKGTAVKIHSDTTTTFIMRSFSIRAA